MEERVREQSREGTVGGQTVWRVCGGSRRRRRGRRGRRRATELSRARQQSVPLPVAPRASNSSQSVGNAAPINTLLAHARRKTATTT